MLTLCTHKVPRAWEYKGLNKQIPHDSGISYMKTFCLLMLIPFMYDCFVSFVGKLMYQTATLIPSLDIILFYGGRGSPAKACGSCYSLQPSDTYALWKEVELDSASQVPEPRWRHTATLVSSRGTCMV